MRFLQIPTRLTIQEDFGTKLINNVNSDLKQQKTDFVNTLIKYDPEWALVSNEEYMEIFDTDNKITSFDDDTFVFKLPVIVLDTSKYLNFMKTYLETEYGVQFEQGKVSSIKNQQNKITGIKFIDNQQNHWSLENHDEYVIWAGFESIELGKMIGIKVPIYGFKGYSINWYFDPDHSTNLLNIL